jgi:hypothetical protein
MSRGPQVWLYEGRPPSYVEFSEISSGLRPTTLVREPLQQVAYAQ